MFWAAVDWTDVAQDGDIFWSVVDWTDMAQGREICWAVVDWTYLAQDGTWFGLLWAGLICLKMGKCV